MISIIGIYKIPAIKHAFFIVSSLKEFSGNSRRLPENKRRMEYFEHILRCKHQWTLKLMSESDFLTVLKQHKPKGIVSPNQSSCSPASLELLTINLAKTPENCLDWAYTSKKILSVIPDEDIIEVFI